LKSENKRKSFRSYLHSLWQGGLEWIKSAQFAKEFTRHLTARKNIVAMLVPRKQTRQNETTKLILHIRQRPISKVEQLWLISMFWILVFVIRQLRNNRE
jgi:hypothetical protein